MSKILDLRASSNLKYLFDGRKGSILDVSGNNLGAAAIAGTPTWARTRKGFGAYAPCAGTNLLGAGNPASLQLSIGTIFAVAERTETIGVVNYQGIAAKPSAYGMYFSSAAEPKAFGCYDYGGGGGWRASTFTERPIPGKPRLFAMSFQSGVVNGTSFFVDGVPCGLNTMTVANQALGVFVCGSGSAGQGLGGSVLLAGIANRVLRPDEHLELYTDWLKEGYVLDVQHRNGVKFFIPAKTDADYAREGIVLDTDFVRQPGGTMRDLTGNYPGTVVGVPVPGTDGEGLRFSTTDDVIFGDVTQLNSVGSFSVEWSQTLPPGNIPASYSFIKYNGVGDNIRCGPLGAPAAAKAVYFAVANGGDAYGASTLQMRAGTSQHFLAVFNGSGVDNSGRVQLYVDGEDGVLAGFIGVIPATTANLAGVNFEETLGAGYTSSRLGKRIYTPPLTAGQARAAYLKNFAQKIVWQAPGEDMPVSLVASYGVANPNALGGEWTIISGTWKRSEDSQGRRWIECVAAGDVTLPAPVSCAFGTNAFVVYKHQLLVDTYVGLTALFGALASAQVGNNGYVTVLDDNRRVRVSRVTDGSVVANLWVTANDFYAVDTPYQFVVARRPSDCRFSQWIKGGAYVPFTTTGGPIADATHTTCGFFHFHAGAGDKILDFDPTTLGNPGHPRIWQGQLDPTRGEVP